MSRLPYVYSTGALRRLLENIQRAKTPANFSYDFMKTEMGVSERSMLSLLRKMEFIDSSGAPSDLYKEFRNPSKSKSSMGRAIEIAFEALYKRNEYIHSAKKEGLRETIASVTGLDHDSKAVDATVNTFEALKSFASFDHKAITEENDLPDELTAANAAREVQNAPLHPTPYSGGLNLGYTINLILPETTNIEVFNSIFKSLNENLLRK